MEYIRIIPEQNDPEAILQFVKILIKIAQRLQSEKNVSQNKT